MKTMRLILSIQEGKPGFADQIGRTRNNLANALKELSKRTDGEEGDRQIDEAIALLEKSAAALVQHQEKINALIARINLARAMQLRAARKEGILGLADMRRSQESFSAIGAEIDQGKNPRLWAIMKQREAELLSLMGARQTDQQQAFASLKLAFETYQKLLPITSRETAPNDWAMLCADMGYAMVAALPLLGEADRGRFANNAVGLFENARPYLVAGGFGQDLEVLDTALATARSTPAVKPR